MINIQLKAKHFYFIIYYLKDKSILQYYKLVNRIKDKLKENNDLDAIFSIEVYPYEVIDIFKMLTSLPEGMSTTINTEMLILLQEQIQQGVISEMQQGILGDENGNLPELAYWQSLAKGIIAGRTENYNICQFAINQGKELINNF